MQNYLTALAVILAVGLPVPAKHSSNGGQLKATPLAETQAPSAHSLKATPSTVKVREATEIVITAKAPATPSLIPASVTLLRLDKQGNVAENLGRMYDDGSHGDAAASDNTFTTRYTVNATEPGELVFKVSVAHRDVLRRALSEPLAVTIRAE